MRCQRPGCPGVIRDGYCDVCGLPPLSPAAPGTSAAPAAGPAAPPGSDAPPLLGRPVGLGQPGGPTPGVGPTLNPAVGLGQPGGPTPGVGPAINPAVGLGRPGGSTAVPGRPNPVAGPPPGARPAAPAAPAAPCRQPGCGGQLQDGYCTVCGAPADAAPPAASAALTSRLAVAPLGSARLAGPLTAASRPKAAYRAHSSGLGAGLTEVPAEPTRDPAQAILTDAVIPEDRRNCPSCGAPVGRSGETGAGRLEGFCPQCRRPYSFTVKLQPGELVAGQYEVQGPLAFGGMGWIHLARDRNVSDRWVVLKGLLNVGDESAQASAIAEQRFLAEVQHPLIVEIYNFVTHHNAAYIVMEFVNGRSLKQILKDRSAAAGGTYSPLPLDQAVAFVLGILPAFTYLHQRGLLYCDFKPDNIMQVEDTVRLIDLGGVRRMDDDQSPIFGTVGFQAPEVAAQGTSVESDIYTIGRTLLVACAEVKGYQSTYQTSLPPPEQLGALGRADSLLRLIAKCCAPSPSDRFGSVEELRLQLVGVLRELVGATHGRPAGTTVASELFSAPTIAADAFDWTQLPQLRPDLGDPAGGWAAATAALAPKARLDILRRPPADTAAVKLARCQAGLALEDHALVRQQVDALLAQDPWEWRAAWMAGLSALLRLDWGEAQSYFNAVLGQTPGELAPKFVLGVTCESGGQLELAERLYQVCATTDSGYLTAAGFGLARVRSRRRSPTGELADLDGVLAALEMIPPTARGYLEARRLAAHRLVGHGTSLPLLQRALDASQAAHLDPMSQATVEVEVFRRALTLVPAAVRGRTVPKLGGVPLTRGDVRQQLERSLRAWAKLEQDLDRRVELIDEANRTRKWTFL